MVTGGRCPTSWLAASLVRVASSSPWDWAVALLQGLKGKCDQGGGQLGVGCGADIDGGTVDGCKKETWLPGGWISWVSDNDELRLERPGTNPRFTGVV